MARERNKLVDYLAYLAARAMAMFVHMFGWEVNYRTARWIGDLLFYFDRRHRLIAIEHLRLSFPEWSDKKVRRVARGSMRSMVYMAFEVLFTTRLITPERWRRHAILTNQRQNIRMLTERKGGIIYVAGHFGNWEIVGYTMAILGFDGFAVARPLDNPYLNRYVMDIRQSRGLTILAKKGATERMDEILRSRRYVSFIADQDAGRKGMFVDFFGRPASTMKGPGLMAMQYKLPLVVGYGKRLDKRYRFEIGIERIIDPQEWADKQDPLRYITQEYTLAMENVIRRNPEQYLWVHRRWKHRPRGEPQAINGIA
ncbi:MAG: lysophospholipid acyltransferase family protein [Planctomycetota bacterium]|jgi:KDO2-lipid IV(A) lauroyltransferase